MTGFIQKEQSVVLADFWLGFEKRRIVEIDVWSLAWSVAEVARG